MTHELKPRISVISMGGTIASTATGGSGGAAPSLDAQHLLDTIPGSSEVATVESIPFRRVPSTEVTLTDVAEVAELIREREAGGAAGTVLTHGTDSLEETAFALDLLHEGDGPVVVTGAMRNPGLPSADGPANLLAAIHVAASPVARGIGCLIVLNDEIHAPRFARKGHTANLATFESPSAGRLGWIVEGRVRIPLAPRSRNHLRVSSATPLPAVALIKASAGDDGRILAALPGLGYEGAVIEALGGGHLPARMADAAASLAQKIPVAVASRTGSGELLQITYEFPGSERDLRRRGLLWSAALDGVKSKVLLTLLLMSGLRGDELQTGFEKIADPS